MSTVSLLESVGTEGGFYFPADVLMGATFPETRWAVDGLVAEGLTLLAGAPKLGKSWLVLGLAVAVASGGVALGRVAVVGGPVLYAALEDNARRMQSRLRIVLNGEPAPPDLAITLRLPALPQAIEVIEGWLVANPGARLVIVDVLRKVRPSEDSRTDIYARDYAIMSQLKALADRYTVAVVVIHHTRKANADDVFDEVSGSTGLTGAADAVMVLKRSRNTSVAALHITGRDVTESECGLTFDPTTCSWTLTDQPVAELEMGDTRRRLLDYLREQGSATPKQAADALGLDHELTKKTLRRMVEDRQVETDGRGIYRPPVLLSPLSLLSPEGDTIDGPCPPESPRTTLDPRARDTGDSRDSPPNGLALTGGVVLTNVSRPTDCAQCNEPLAEADLLANATVHAHCELIGA